MNYSVSNTLPFLGIESSIKRLSIGSPRTSAIAWMHLVNVLTAIQICSDSFFFIHRAYKIYKTDYDVTSELTFCKQMLVNSGFSKRDFDSELTLIRLLHGTKLE